MHTPRFTISPLCLALMIFFMPAPGLRAETAPADEDKPCCPLCAPTLSDRYQHIDAFITEHPSYGGLGRDVLKIAYLSLKEKQDAGEADLVGIEDLWTHAQQEGRSLMDKPGAIWGKTTAEQTADMIGQTTIGPWQMTLRNIRSTYGPPYGIEPEWSNNDIYTFCRDNPDVQAKMIIDYIQRSYERLGKRTPYAIQRYFWLEPFVRGELGQADDWTKSVLAKPPPGGTWQDLTPAMKADTGFYAQQILLGAHYTDAGLLFWLAVSDDHQAIRDTLITWRDQKRLVVTPETEDDATSDGATTLENIRYQLTDEPGGFTIKPEDVRFYQDHTDLHQAVRTIVEEVAQETP